MRRRRARGQGQRAVTPDRQYTGRSSVHSTQYTQSVERRPQDSAEQPSAEEAGHHKSQQRHTAQLGTVGPRQTALVVVEPAGQDGRQWSVTIHSSHRARDKLRMSDMFYLS